MLGAIFGDIVGSAYEFRNTHNYDFTLLTRWSKPTDDSCMTLAVAYGLIRARGKNDQETRDILIDSMKLLGQKYPGAGYGGMFYHWVLSDERRPYNSYGNGSAMRVSPAGWLYDTLEETVHQAALTAEVTHNHPEGIKGAQATAAAIYLARTGSRIPEIRDYLEQSFGYDLHRSMDQIVSRGHGEEICQISVPQALICFFNSTGYEDTIRKAVSIGGDSDTIACIAGSIAEAYYGFPEEFEKETMERTDEFMHEIINEFRKASPYYQK